MSTVPGSESVTLGSDLPVWTTGGGSETLTSCVVADGDDNTSDSLEIKDLEKY